MNNFIIHFGLFLPRQIPEPVEFLFVVTVSHSLYLELMDPHAVALLLEQDLVMVDLLSNKYDVYPCEQLFAFTYVCVCVCVVLESCNKG